jgi:2-polyprenyl-3-methyl-5-hydroxy-6-metoxy-1,4-benzoquinol methylase
MGCMPALSEARVEPSCGGPRFEFGKNWSRFLSLVDESRVLQAERSLQEMLEAARLDGRSFLDVGSGSGLFSLAARRLGARVHSFDYDRDAVRCTATLRERFFGDDPLWKVEHGSILDRAYVQSLGAWDIVYSWGVLHHTGAMWQALNHVAALVRPGGLLWVAIYNDQGRASRRWLTLEPISKLLS